MKTTISTEEENRTNTALKEDTIKDRLTDMQERYGELCNQQKAAKILGVSRRTIIRMLEDGRLRRVETKVDVRSICRYIEHPEQTDFNARYEKKYNRKTKQQIDFYASSIQRNK